MLGSIPASLLTGSQRTCLALAQSLGVNYVWIDGLCVIQDDDTDWRTESAKMSEIHENATLTIITSASLPYPPKRRVADFWHDLNWCFGDDTSLAGQYTVSAADGEALEIWRGGKYRSESLSFVNFSPGADNFIWRSRGWAFQEELLSRRKLYLGDTRMQFICTRSRGIEDTLWLRKKQPLYIFKVDSVLFLTEAALADHVSAGGLSMSDLTVRRAYDLWYRTVKSYGHRMLTYPTDTIVAIGGLAKRMVPIMQTLQPSVDIEYIGGIWKADVFRGILWASSDIDRSGPVSLPCRSQLPAKPAGASWLWSSFPLPATRMQQHIRDKTWRFQFLLEGQNTPACNTITSDCRVASWTLEPNSAPVFTPETVHGEIEITGKMVELECVWEFRVSPFEGFQSLALPAPLEGLQGYDESELDPEGSAGVSVRFGWPFTDDPSTRLWDDAVINAGIDCQWTQALHDNVSQGDFRVYAMLLAYGVVKHPPRHLGLKSTHRMSTIGLLLVPHDPKALTPTKFQRLGLFLFPGRPVVVSESSAVLDTTEARLCLHKAFRQAKTCTVIVD